MILYLYQQSKINLDDLDEAIHKAMDEEEEQGDGYA